MPEAGKVVLVVDDKAENRKLMSGLLAGSGYTVLTAMGGLDCLSLLGRVRPNLIILDIMMPDMDGFETCRRIRAEIGFKQVPILFLTAYPFAENVAKGRAVGANDFVAKPFDIDVLRTRVASLIANAARSFAAPARRMPTPDR
jgi:CheY-like chemotaxis protein